MLKSKFPGRTRKGSRRSVRTSGHVRAAEEFGGLAMADEIGKGLDLFSRLHGSTKSHSLHDVSKPSMILLISKQAYFFAEVRKLRVKITQGNVIASRIFLRKLKCFSISSTELANFDITFAFGCFDDLIKANKIYDVQTFAITQRN